jgi:hypothetical protein
MLLGTSHFNYRRILMNDLAIKLIALLNAADQVGSDDCQLGDAMSAVSDAVDRYTDLPEANYKVAMVEVIEKSLEFFDHPAAIQFLEDALELCK